MAPEEPPFRFEHDSGRFRLYGELDLATVPDLELVLLDAVRDGEVVIDLRELEFCDSSCLKLLLQVGQIAHGNGRVMRVVRPRAGGEVAKVLAISGVESVFEFLDESSG